MTITAFAKDHTLASTSHSLKHFSRIGYLVICVKVLVLVSLYQRRLVKHRASAHLYECKHLSARRCMCICLISTCITVLTLILYRILAIAMKLSLMYILTTLFAKTYLKKTFSRSMKFQKEQFAK